MQVVRFQDCSGNDTHYRYDYRGHLIALTEALNNTTTLERKPHGEVLRINHPDGSVEPITYNTLGQPLRPRQRQPPQTLGKPRIQIRRLGQPDRKSRRHRALADLHLQLRKPPGQNRNHG
ncbi:hypothetical protein BKM09_011865 [Pseudomonas amygdali pv. morsprunorum]|nr:hypothetical protein BKM19_028895 [Pseudomonas amygdali pv. morsprunorum]POP90711.1 hypothetical protein CXB39_21355 [Pseudomonas amygdali pv. morsprunorum]POY79465.1 hypothetical protein BKM09_011865 [Pseudomonas amygdali pv. morsprunorum]